jgi:hypothetical protein
MGRSVKVTSCIGATQCVNLTIDENAVESFDTT